MDVSMIQPKSAVMDPKARKDLPKGLNSKNCTLEDEQDDDSKRAECFQAADEMFQKQLTDPQSIYGRSLCEQISNKVNYCIPTFNQKCSTDQQIMDFQIGNVVYFILGPAKPISAPRLWPR